MGKIRLACDSAQKHVKLITECVIEGEDDDITTMVPVSLKSMRKTAKDCAEWSREISSKFKHTLKLLEEVYCSCLATEKTNAERQKELGCQKENLAFEKVAAEENKEKEQDKIKELVKKMDEEREAYLKDFQESQNKVSELKKKVITEEDELEKFKLELKEAQNNVNEESKKRGWLKWMFHIKTDGQKEAEKEKKEKDSHIKYQEKEVNTKRNMVNTDIESENSIINKKEESMKSNEARRIENKCTSVKEMAALSSKISETLIKISTTDAKKLDIEAIKELLREGIEKVAELEAHWKRLVVFFEEISSVTEVAMGKAIEDFAGAAKSAKLQGKVAEGSSNSLKTFTKKKLIQFAFDAYSRCNGVSIVSKSYLKISDTYLMPSIIQLGTLVAIDAEREPEKIKSMTKEILSRSKMTIDFVKQVVTSAKLANENEIKAKAIEYK